MTAEDFITENYEHNNWGNYPPSRRLVTEWLEAYHQAKLKELEYNNNNLFCSCVEPKLYERHLGDGGYDWCKCGKMLGDKKN